MNLHTLELRRDRVNRLLCNAMADGYFHKTIQARYLLEQINSRILKLKSLSNSYSNLAA